MSSRSIRRRAMMLSATAALAACAAPAMPPLPEVALPSAYAAPLAASAAGGMAMPATDWWTAYGDARLDQLEADVDASNFSLARALAQLRRARAEVDAQAAARQPQAALAADAERDHTSANIVGHSLAGRTVDDHTIGATASWEPDLFGRIDLQVSAARADAEASAADVAALRLSLHAEVAHDLLAVRALDAEQTLLARALADAQALLELTRSRLAAGTASELDVDQSEQELQSLQAQLVDLAATRTALVDALATLTGRAAAGFVVDAARFEDRVPETAPGLPSALLQRRPDIAAAARRVDATNARAGLAQRAWFPDIVLSLAAGFESTALGPLLALPSRSWAVGPGVTLPLFDGGRRRAGQAQAAADVDAAAAGYRETVISAVNEVETQLATLHTLRAEADHQERAVHWAGRATEVARARYAAGASSYVDVLVAQRAQITTERAALDVERRRLQASVDLAQALGGGWCDAAG